MLFTFEFPRRFQIVARRTLAALAACALVGCNPPAPVKPSNAEATQSSEAGGNAIRDKRSRDSSDKHSSREAKSAGTHIGQIPKDAWPEIFFEDPLKVAAEGQSAPVQVSPPQDERAVATLPTNATTPAETAGSATGSKTADRSADWATLISGDEMADEVKAIKARLNDWLQSVGKYNGNYKEIRYDAATLAALAAIAVEHPDAPGWKRHARHVRDVSAEVVVSAAGLGEKSYQPARAAFDKLDALLSGSVPPGLEESSDTLPLSELVTRVPLMYRMERAYNWLKLTVNTEPVFKKEASRVAHESALLATLAKSIAWAGYADADNDEYLVVSRELTKAGLQSLEASREGDFSKYTAALDRAGKACTECHSNFKNN